MIVRLVIAVVFAIALAAAGLSQGAAVGQSQGGGQAGQGGQRGGRGAQPARPAPRWPDGKVRLGPAPGEKGLWLPAGGGGERLVSLDNDGGERGAGARGGGAQFPGKISVSQVPFLPWAKALYAYRNDNQFEPHTRCKPSGGPRQFLTPYGVDIVERPDLQRIYIMDLGGPHTWRTIYVNAEHPKNLEPSHYGHSIGRWEGDTLVVETIGFNEGFWIDRQGLPHTKQLRMIERFTRTDANTMGYEVIIDDPGAYSSTWKSGFYLSWRPGEELFEYVCQDGNLASELMIGAEKSVDRTSEIAP